MIVPVLLVLGFAYANCAITCPGIQFISCSKVVEGEVCLEDFDGTNLALQISAYSTLKPTNLKIFVDLSDSNGMSRHVTAFSLAYGNFRQSRSRVLYDAFPLGPMGGCGSCTKWAETCAYTLTDGRLQACGKTFLGEDVVIDANRNVICVQYLEQANSLELAGQIDDLMGMFYLQRNGTLNDRSGLCSSAAFVEREVVERADEYQVFSAPNAQGGKVGIPISRNAFILGHCTGGGDLTIEPPSNHTKELTTPPMIITSGATLGTTTVNETLINDCWGVLCENWEKGLFAIALPVLGLMLILILIFFGSWQCKKRMARGGGGW